jgi:hypothetical protein
MDDEAVDEGEARREQVDDEAGWPGGTITLI